MMSGSAEALDVLQTRAFPRWRRRDVLLFTPLALLIGYVASPYVAVARLGYAVRVNDLHVLSDAVDWSRIRADLNEEINPNAPNLAAARQTSVSSDDDLPEFGQSFATAATSNAIEAHVTPTGLEAVLSDGDHPSATGLLTDIRNVIDGAVFIGLDRFELRLPTGATGGGTIRIGLRFSASHGWRVERVVLPPDMIGADTRHG